jgi:zinc protease
LGTVAIGKRRRAAWPTKDQGSATRLFHQGLRVRGKVPIMSGMSRHIGPLCLLLLACRMPAAEINIAYEKFTLPNGLTVLVHEDHKAPIVAVNTWFHVGSKNEKMGKTGFAHLFEHLMFGGSENFKGRYIDAMEKVGATDLNGTTNEDRTNYFENVPVSALDQTLFLESDRMGHFYKSINKEVLDLQRGVVQNEKRQGENQPYAVAEELIVKNTAPVGHPYSWTVIGAMEDLDAASLSDVQKWFQTYYGPSNAVLVLAGDIDLKTAKEKVTRYYGDIPPGPPIARPTVSIAKMTGEHRGQVQDRVAQALLTMTWNTPPWSTRDSVLLELIGQVLSDGKTSRFYKRLVYDDRSATQVQAGQNGREINGQFQIYVFAQPGAGLEKLEASVREELARFLKDGPTDSELERVKVQYEAGLVRGMERIGGFGGKSDRLAQGAVFAGNPEQYKVALNWVRQATKADLQQVARAWLSDGVYILEVHPFPEFKPVTSTVDRTKLPGNSVPEDPKLPKFQRATLSNGLKVVLAERHDTPLVSFWMQVRAGSSADEPSKLGATMLMSAVLTSGTKSRDSLQISDELQRLGANLDAYSNLDFTMIQLSALTDKLDRSLDLYADVLMNATFPENEFKREQAIQLANIQQEQSEPFGMALRVFPPLLFGAGHAYAMPYSGSGRAETVGKLHREDLEKLYTTWVRPNNSVLVVVGDTSLSELVPKLEKRLAAWKPGGIPSRSVAQVQRPKQPLVYLIDKPDALQSVIIAGGIAPPINAAQEVALGTLNDIWGGTFGSRLNMNLREDKHWSYGARSVLLATTAQRPFIGMAPVQTDKTKESLEEMVKEFKEVVGSRPPTEEELEKAKLRKVLGLPGSRETQNAIGASMRTILQGGLPDDYWDTYAGKVKALSTADLKDAARTLIDPDHLIWVIVGDRVKIEKSIRELNLGELRIIDAQ